MQIRRARIAALYQDQPGILKLFDIGTDALHRMPQPILVIGSLGIARYFCTKYIGRGRMLWIIADLRSDVVFHRDQQRAEVSGQLCSQVARTMEVTMTYLDRAGGREEELTRIDAGLRASGLVVVKIGDNHVSVIYR